LEYFKHNGFTENPKSQKHHHVFVKKFLKKINDIVKEKYVACQLMLLCRIDYEEMIMRVESTNMRVIIFFKRQKRELSYAMYLMQIHRVKITLM
jgi:ADP-glucose pyrophosphorylase